MNTRKTRRIAATACAGIAGAFTLGSVGDAGAANSMVMVRVQEAGVRSGPSYDGTTLIKTKHYGDCVHAVSGPSPSGGYDWFQVSLADGSRGWMRNDLVDGAGC